ncbi:hypothetical protein CEY12_13190 [Chryseobacterium sp. T16E-39]|uniref:hypothetical protein n=1 Tax=Chryseobacterium sp. T16E-39 TaxID=2015076 RepID=UPI000B5B1311|nr:hypothetical protein [Chryseobacterium sp. T16E-39]ASK31000.1 hypothetical protein CEY12_13190 [Chryseobacterium sp. T16E-39]
MKKNYYQRTIFTLVLFVFSISCYAQVGINTTSPHPNAQLEIFSESKGLQVPRLTTSQRDAMDPSPTQSANGIIIFNTTTKCLEYYNGTQWVNWCGSDTTRETLVTRLNCSGTQTGLFSANQPSTGTKEIMYEGGNGGSYSSMSIASTGVTGLIATAPAGTLANGSGTIIFDISGVPTTTGMAYFTINLGDKTCTFSINIDSDTNNFDTYTVIQIGSSARELPNGIPIIGTEANNGGFGSGLPNGPGVTTELLRTVLSGLTKPVEFLGLIPNNNSIEGLRKIFENTASDRKRREVVLIYTGYNISSPTFTSQINSLINDYYVRKGKIYLTSADEGNWNSYTFFSTDSYGKVNAYLPSYSIDGTKLVEQGDIFPTKYGNVTSSGVLSSKYWGNSLVPPTNASIVSHIISSSTAGAVGAPIIFKDNNYNGKVWVFGDTDAYWQRDTAVFGAQPYLNTSCTSNDRQKFTCNMFHYITRKNLGLPVN